MNRLTPAERILIDLGITIPKEIDLEVVAWSLGAAVKSRPLDGSEAIIVGSQHRAVITVNRTSPPARRRFSIGHEIGHWHHHRGRILFCGGRDIDNPADGALNVERQADDFASDLILPNYMFQPTLAKLRRLNLKSIRQIADDFQASITATLLKTVHANRFPIIVVCHGKAGRRWFRRPALIPTWWFPRADLDPDSFAFSMLFANAPEETFPRKIGGGAWFDFRNADRYEIQEQSFPLPNEEILTVLIIPEEGLG
jgi:hypothetical protein